MYIVEGNIGAGKSTFLSMLGKHFPEITIALEPVNKWHAQDYGQSLLGNFYQDPKRWAFTLETLAMICRVRDHIHEQQKEHTVVMERSIYSGHYCFTTNSYASGFLTDLEWELYCTWFNYLIPHNCHAPQGFIYLSVDPHIAYERIAQRGREAEKGITLEYLQQIDARHEEFLIKKNNVIDEIKNVPVLVLDCNQDFEHCPEVFQEHVAKLKQFVHATKQAAANKQSSPTQQL